jgi:hypothetical protein
MTDYADIPDVSDIIPDYEVLDGDKVNIETVLNVPIVVTGWIIGGTVVFLIGMLAVNLKLPSKNKTA